MKILHFADTHFGYERHGKIDPESGIHSRVLDFSNSMDWIITDGLNQGAELAIFSGDAYKDRDPNQTIQKIFVEHIKRLADKVPVIMIVGNHDLPSAAGKANTLEIFKYLNTACPIFVSSRPEVIRIDGIEIATLPYPNRSTLLTKDEYKDKSQEELNQIINQKIEDMLAVLAGQIRSTEAILAAHITVEGALTGSENQMMIGRDIALRQSSIPDIFKYVALGHIHKQQELSRKNTVYAGSIDRCDFGEEKEDKGYVMVNFRNKTTYEFIPNPQVRKFVTIEKDVNAWDLSLPDIKGAVVRAKIKMKDQDCFEEKEFRKQMEDAGAYFIASIEKDIERSDRQRSQISKEMNLEESLKAYIESKPDLKPMETALIAETKKLSEGII